MVNVKLKVRAYFNEDITELTPEDARDTMKDFCEHHNMKWIKEDNYLILLDKPIELRFMIEVNEPDEDDYCAYVKNKINKTFRTEGTNSFKDIEEPLIHHLKVEMT